MPLLSTGEVAELLGMPAPTVKSWTRGPNRLITPRVPSRGTGRHQMMDVQQAWAIAVAKSMRDKGYSIDAAAQVAEFLDRLPTEEIERAFAEEPPRDSIMVAFGDILPELVHRNAVLEHAEIREIVKYLESVGMKSVKPTIIDVKKSWDQVWRRIKRR